MKVDFSGESRKKAFRLVGDDLPGIPGGIFSPSGTARIGSIPADGNWWIVILALAVVGAGAFIVVKKKKKPATDDGTGSDNEE